MTIPSTAMARRPAARETALLIPDATPTRPRATELITVFGEGARSEKGQRQHWIPAARFNENKKREKNNSTDQRTKDTRSCDAACGRFDQSVDKRSQPERCENCPEPIESSLGGV